MSSAPQALLSLPAPAKLNLFLHVVGRRADGYHLIESVFQLIDWCDTIDLELRRDGQITREDVIDASQSQTILPENDLCIRAAKALQAASGTALGVHIRLKKTIPSQAGMGGGSSDAATVLLGLKSIWNLREQLPKLEQIGLQLGADVPFFLRGRNAWVSGIGENIEALPPNILRSDQHFAVIKPARGLPTAAIFTSPLLKRDTAPAIIEDFADDPYYFGRNDLQSVGERVEPEVGAALHLLSAQGLSPFKPRMTGSGSAVFAPCPADFQFDTKAIPPLWQHRVCKALNEHPIHALLNQRS